MQRRSINLVQGFLLGLILNKILCLRTQLLQEVAGRSLSALSPLTAGRSDLCSGLGLVD